MVERTARVAVNQVSLVVDGTQHNKMRSGDEECVAVR